MVEEERQDHPEVLAPTNFVAFTGAGLKLFKPVWGRITLAFLGLIILLFGASIGAAYLTSSTESEAAVAIFQIAQLLALPFAGSLVMGRAARAMIAARGGGHVSIFRDPALKDVRSHLLAAAMLSAFLTFAITVALGPLGNFLGTHLMLGPPILVHVIALERMSFTDGWAETKDIARGQALRTFLYLLCLALALVLVEQSVGAGVFTLLANSMNDETAALINLPILGAVLSVGMALMSAFALMSYLELRARFDETDIDAVVTDLNEEYEEAEDEEEEPPEE